MADKTDNKSLLRQLQSKLSGEGKGDPMGSHLMQIGPNHQVTKRKITRIGVDLENQGLISQTKTDHTLNERGKLEEVEQEVIYATTLEDGSPANKYGIVICQTCGRLARYSNTIRCEMCGYTCHILMGCGIFSAKAMGWVCKNCYAQLGG